MFKSQLKYILIFCIVICLTIFFAIYVSKLLFGDNSLEVYLSLKNKKNYLVDETVRYKLENSKLQKNYFELKNLEPQND